MATVKKVSASVTTELEAVNIFHTHTHTLQSEKLTEPPQTEQSVNKLYGV